jgi:Ser/Thr protein kinase RdoA (MazF antagonist)
VIETAKTHGLDGTLVAPDWPPLTHEEVARVLHCYSEIAGPFELVSASPRPFSAASVVSTSDGKIFVKRHASVVRNAESLLEEHRFMQHVRGRGVPVPRVLIADSGESTVEMGAWTYEVQETATGVDAYEDAISWTPFRSPHHARSAGVMLARLHDAARGYEAPARTGRPLVAGFSIFSARNPAAEMERYVAARPALRNYLSQRDCAGEALSLLEPFHQELLPLLPDLEPLWTHNDFHASNLFWSGTGKHASATAVIDFGLCDRTNAVHDLAHAIERNIVEWLVLVNNPAHPEKVPVHLDHLQALLDGYESARPLSRAEALALAPMMGLCHAEFALSETDYFLSALHSEEKAFMACEGYLVSHARWWRGPGRMLLDFLRAWAARNGPTDRVDTKG